MSRDCQLSNVPVTEFLDTCSKIGATKICYKMDQQCVRSFGLKHENYYLKETYLKFLGITQLNQFFNNALSAQALVRLRLLI